MEPFRPQVVAPRGIVEDNCYAMSDPTAFALKAVNSRGQCIDFAIVANWTEYDEALARLTGLLDDQDPVDGPDATGVVKAAMYRRSASAAAPLKLLAQLVWGWPVVA